jgi:DNA-binding response OmpR family regulator
MADRLQAVRPNSRLLFVSGFTDDEMIHREIILAGSAFLQKPFSPTSLVAKIGEMLREPLAGAPEAPEAPEAP